MLLCNISDHWDLFVEHVSYLLRSKLRNVVVVTFVSICVHRKYYVLISHMTKNISLIPGADVWDGRWIRVG